MAGLIRVRAGSERRRRAGLSFSREWQELNNSQVDEAQLLAILEDGELAVQFAQDADAPEWKECPCREEAIAALRDHIAYDLAHGRPHDKLTGRDPDTQFQSANEAETRTEVGAPVSGAAEAKDETGTSDAASSVDLIGGEASAAEAAQESREGTEDDATAQEAASAGENEPGESLQPPVAATDAAEAAVLAAASEAPGKKSTGSARRKA